MTASRHDRCIHMKWLKRFWKRHVSGRPDGYQAYVSIPTDTDRPTVGEVHDLIEELEHVFEGRVDVYARVDRLAVVTDWVPGEQLDASEIDAALDTLEDLYAETHALARLEKWRSIEGQLVKTYVAVPVKPLFPRSDDGKVTAKPPAD